MLGGPRGPLPKLCSALYLQKTFCHGSGLFLVKKHWESHRKDPEKEGDRSSRCTSRNTMAGRDRPPTVWPWEGGLLPRQIPVPSAKVGSRSRELEGVAGAGSQGLGESGDWSGKEAGHGGGDSLKGQSAH